MKQDVFGQDVSLSTDAAMRCWNATMLAFLAHAAATPRHLGEVLTAEPGFALGHAVKGMFYILLGRRELMQTARTALADAKSAAANATITAREQKFVDALDVWMQGYPGTAANLLAGILQKHPEDSLAMKLEHATRFVLGDIAGMRRSIETVLPAYQPDHAGRGYLLGCYAFALEETGDYARAEIAGRQALWMAPDDAWGLHAVAHVHDMTANAQAGIDWLTGREAAWDHCNNFRYHVWWHKALMHLDLGQVDTVLALYDTEIRADRTDDYRDISNATSLLSRLELDGVDVGDRWDELADICAARTEDGCLIFADLHYLLALTGGNREAEAVHMLCRIARDAETCKDEVQERMGNPGLSAARGLYAFGEGDFSGAFRHLAAARPAMQTAGGSHAQRDIFERLTIDAGIRAGQIDMAERFLNDRQARRAGTEDGYAAARRVLIDAARGRDAAQGALAQ
ncbi:MAG: tetratricopeptide repeat protein [Rhodobacteraceae bacterium]|nr:tetratricopeptide repeat protein [Paracoccaceae bacterium]